MTASGPPIERDQVAGRAKGGRRRSWPARAALMAWLVLGSSVLGFGGLGCWAARTRVVEAPEISSVPAQLSIARPTGSTLTRDGTPAALASTATPPDAWEPVADERPWRYIVLHHSGTDHGSVESIDAEHRQRTDEEGNSWLGIGYHFVIGNGDEMPDGEIVPTFRWREQMAGAHAGTTEHNSQGIGICVIGDCQSRPPSNRQVESLKRLVGTLAVRYQIERTDVLAHGDVKATDCPGRYFPLEEVVAAADLDSITNKVSPSKSIPR